MIWLLLLFTYLWAAFTIWGILFAIEKWMGWGKKEGWRNKPHIAAIWPVLLIVGLCIWWYEN